MVYPYRGTPDPLFLCCGSLTGHLSGHLPRPCSLEFDRVATLRWSGPLPISLSCPSPPGGLSQCSQALWAKLLCAHLSQEGPPRKSVNTLGSKSCSPERGVLTSLQPSEPSPQSHSECCVKSPHLCVLALQWLGQGLYPMDCFLEYRVVPKVSSGPGWTQLLLHQGSRAELSQKGPLS